MGQENMNGLMDNLMMVVGKKEKRTVMAYGALLEAIATKDNG